jgi:hypothetical protein
MASAFDKNLLPEFDSIKDNDEKIIWTGRPNFIPFILSGLWGNIFLIVFVAIWFAISTSIKPENDSTGGWNFWLGLLPLAIFLWNFLSRLFSFNNTVYAYSNKRVEQAL